MMPRSGRTCLEQGGADRGFELGFAPSEQIADYLSGSSLGA
jgi:hypothetical protein